MFSWIKKVIYSKKVKRLQRERLIREGIEIEKKADEVKFEAERVLMLEKFCPVIGGTCRKDCAAFEKGRVGLSFNHAGCKLFR